MLTQQCYAPIGEGKRCPNSAKDENKLHCSKHYDKALKLYVTYKRVCTRAQDLKLDTVNDLPTPAEKITFLNRCYTIFKQAYEGRMQHRNYAIVPECQDWGHDRQFTLLLGNMDWCEEHLVRIYGQLVASKKPPQPVGEELPLEKEVQLVEEPLGVEGQLEEIKRFKERRAKDDRDTEQMLAKYNKINKKALMTKKRIIDQFMKFIMDRIPPNTRYIEHLMICMVISFLHFAKLNYSNHIGAYPKGDDLSRYYTNHLYEFRKFGKLFPNSDVRIFLHNCQHEDIRMVGEIMKIVGRPVGALLGFVVDLWQAAEINVKSSVFNFRIEEGNFVPDILNPT